jgi:hypothetical protein
MTVKTQRQGDSILIPVPATFNIGENVEYQPTIDKNGVITLIPIKRHIFDSNPDYDLRKDIKGENIGDNGPAVGRENMWHDRGCISDLIWISHELLRVLRRRSFNRPII